MPLKVPDSIFELVTVVLEVVDAVPLPTDNLVKEGEVVRVSEGVEDLERR